MAGRHGNYGEGEGILRRKRIRELSESEKSEMCGEIDIKAVFPVVERIIKDVKERGDAALIEYTERFDGVRLHPSEIEVSEEEIKAAESEIDDELKESISRAADAISAFHIRQKSRSWFEDFSGFGDGGRSDSQRSDLQRSNDIILGEIFVPLERVGVYVPASYFSTALMCVVPARVAGVREIMMCTPPERGGDGRINAETLFAANLAGASRIFRIGGAQAIAALAFGTETIPKVQKVVGPGNIYVTAAKMLIRSHTEIDFPAGPSEIMIIADDSANPQFIAADMLAQAEHGIHSKAILLTNSQEIASSVERLIQSHISQHSQHSQNSQHSHSQPHAHQPLAHSQPHTHSPNSPNSPNSPSPPNPPNPPNPQTHSKTPQAAQFWILLGSIEECVDFANEYAPEHLEIMVRNPLEILKRVRNAGSVFIGPFSPVAAGDYATGANHVLPTAGYARIFSGLDVSHFMRRMTVQILSESGLRKLKDTIVRMAQAEGMEMHARSVEVRFQSESCGDS